MHLDNFHSLAITIHPQNIKLRKKSRNVVLLKWHHAINYISIRVTLWLSYPSDTLNSNNLRKEKNHKNAFI